MSKFLVKFVDGLETVVDDLSVIFSHENDLRVLSVGIHHFKKSDPEFLAKEYYKYIYKYRDLIKNKEIQKIMDLDLSDDLQDLGNKQDIKLKIDHFKKLLKSDINYETKLDFLGHLQKLNDFIFLIQNHEKSIAFE